MVLSKGEYQSDYQFDRFLSVEFVNLASNEVPLVFSVGFVFRVKMPKKKKIWVWSRVSIRCGGFDQVLTRIGLKRVSIM